MPSRVLRLVAPIRSLPLVFRLEDFLYGHLIERRLDDIRSRIPRPRPVNSTLKSGAEIRDARAFLASLKVKDRYDHPAKAWDGVRFFTFIVSYAHRGARILDMGSGPHSNVLRWLELYGFRDLWAVDLIFQRPLRRGAIRYSGYDMQRTGFQDASFDVVFAQSAIEHGADWNVFLREASRLITPGGFLLVSTDFWPTKIDTSGLTMYGGPWMIFSETELKRFVEEAYEAGFRLVDPLDLSVGEPVLEVFGKRYTFVFVAFEKGDHGGRAFGPSKGISR